MKKPDIVERVAGEAGITKQAAQAVVGAVFTSIRESLARGEAVAVTGFGRFARTDRPAREGRNPRTGEPIGGVACLRLVVRQAFGTVMR